MKCLPEANNMTPTLSSHIEVEEAGLAKNWWKVQVPKLFQNCTTWNQPNIVNWPYPDL